MARSASRGEGFGTAIAGMSVWAMMLSLIVLALSVFGLVMVFSSSSITAISNDLDATYFLTRQGLMVVAGVAAVVAMHVFPVMSMLRSPAFQGMIWIGCVALIVITAVMGFAVFGAQRWVEIGGIKFQPSEFAKLGIVLMAARIFTDWREGKLGGWDLVKEIAFYLLLPVGMVFALQSDMGTALIIAMGIIAAAWLAEVRSLFIVAVVVLGVLVVLSTMIGSDYRSDRWVFLDPKNDGQGGYGTGYQIIHSYYALADGGLFGMGLGASRQKYLYLTQSETDFIFAVIGEELGLLGCLVVIVLFLALLYTGLKIAREAVDAFGCVLAGSLTILLTAQAFVNIGSVIGVLPTTGKPLPFISYGGTSIIACFLAVGAILLVARESVVSDRYQVNRENLRFVRARR